VDLQPDRSELQAYSTTDGLRIAHRKDDNALMACADPEALQATADRLTPEVIRKSLDYWRLIIGPKFSKREQKAMNVRRADYIHQIEYCRNFIGLNLLTGNQIAKFYRTMFVINGLRASLANEAVLFHCNVALGEPNAQVAS